MKVLAQNPVRAYAAMLRGRTWDKPIVSAIHGLCLTGGFEMVMGTDLRIASEDAEFWMREASFGIMPTRGSNAYLPREIPPDAAMEMAERIAGNGPLAVSGILKCIRETMDNDIETAMNKELEIGMPNVVSTDAREGGQSVQGEAYGRLQRQVSVTRKMGPDSLRFQRL